MTFVKAAGTSVPVARSQGEAERILRRYGASGFGVTSDYKNHTIRVGFRVPDRDGLDTVQVPVRLEINIEQVARQLYGEKLDTEQTRWVRGQLRTTDASRRFEQAERVAWRLLVDWIDAACSAANAGLQSMSEAFLAHTLVKGEDGQVVRIIEQLNQRGEWRALLPSGEAK